MSSKFRYVGRVAVTACVLGVSLFHAAPLLAAPSVRAGDVVRIPGAELRALAGYPVDQLTVVACRTGSCGPIPFQIDQRDASGNWALDHGPEPNAAALSGVLQDTDLLLFMAADTGERVDPGEFSSASGLAEIAIHDALAESTSWAYLLVYPRHAPRSDVSYVEYDAANDRVRGARVSLGFHRGMPNYLALNGTVAGEQPGPNLLDRLKVRASATFLWGLIHFSRNEDDLSTQFVAWKQGPIRVVRRQRQWVRIGWGIRSPTFGSYTYFYRDFAELPVSLRLNFPPHYFFGDITVRALLDFRNLTGWSVWTPSLPTPLPIDGTMTAAKRALNDASDPWFALLSSQVTLVQRMELSASLASVHRHLSYLETDRPDPPEAVTGAIPAVGFRLDDWEEVGAGLHQLSSLSYAVPPGVDVAAFVAAQSTPLQVQVSVQPLQSH